MSILVFIISFLIMNIVNKYILKEKNLILGIFFSIFICILFLKFGIGVEFFKFSFLTLILTIIGWIDFKTQDVYTSHIIIGGLGGIFFLGLDLFLDKGFNLSIIKGFCIFIAGILIIGIFDYMCKDERVIYGSLVCIYLLYFFFKGNLNLINIFSACVIPSLVIGALALAGGMGWGDVEIIFICGLFLGFKLSLLNLFIGIILGGIYSIYLIIFKKKMGKTQIAFGPFIAMGTGVTILLGEGLINWYISFI